ncbi:carbamoyl phosphate synthase large subunit [uncultured Alistipes sp.]|uniref:carbamoyl phosphate synthase large subunit n=1 Tax=uncultured Alistipes sp. TaxID=538949 RepID=UPI00345D6D14
MRHNILITSAGKRVALVRAFRSSMDRIFPEGKILTTDMNPEMAPTGYVSDGCFRVPAVSAADYIPALLEICRRNDIGMIVPTIDTELSLLASCKSRFEAEGVAVIVSDPLFVAMCRDKRNTGDFFTSRSIRTPRPIDKANPTFPLFAKPYDGSLSRNLHYITCPEELTPAILADPKLMFMEYIDKSRYKEYTVDLYYGRDHELKMVVPRERIEIRAGEINKGRTEKGALVAYRNRVWIGSRDASDVFACSCFMIPKQAIRSVSKSIPASAAATRSLMQPEPITPNG